MRTGPAWVVAGIGLFVAALVASGYDGFEPPSAARIEHQPLAGASALDIGQVKLETLLLTGRDDLRLEYTLVPWMSAERKKDARPPAIWSRRGDAVVLGGQLEGHVASDTRLLVPAGIARIAGEGLRVETNVPVDHLRIDGTNVSWRGRARLLEVHLRRGSGAGCQGRPTFTLGKSSTDVLRIHAREGQLDLSALDAAGEVGTLEVHASPSVTLTGVAIGKLPRIRLLPPAADAGDGSVDASAATTGPAGAVATGCHDG